MPSALQREALSAAGGRHVRLPSHRLSRRCESRTLPPSRLGALGANAVDLCFSDLPPLRGTFVYPAARASIFSRPRFGRLPLSLSLAQAQPSRPIHNCVSIDTPAYGGRSSRAVVWACFFPRRAAYSRESSAYAPVWTMLTFFGSPAFSCVFAERPRGCCSRTSSPFRRGRKSAPLQAPNNVFHVP